MSNPKSSFERRKWILETLRQRGSLSLEEITAELGVSNMTINRDVQHLETEGSVKRIHGGIVQPDVAPQETTCATCHAPISNRMQFLYTTTTGANQVYCCPHCGFARLGRLSNVIGVYATDFLYGTMIDANNATYVIGSRVSLCCEPTVLSFKDSQQAEAFCRGFGGKTYPITEAIKFLYPNKFENTY
jgi:DeoR family transcriptional regulator, copper-sensing transcriptional repressor